MICFLRKGADDVDSEGSKGGEVYVENKGIGRRGRETDLDRARESLRSVLRAEIGGEELSPRALFDRLDTNATGEVGWCSIGEYLLSPRVKAQE